MKRLVQGLKNIADCVIASPPPWDGKQSIGKYVVSVVEDMAVVRGAVSESAVVWLNIRDAYCSDDCGCGVKPDELALLPERCAIALQDDGWFVRSVVVLTRQKAPLGVTGRPARSHGCLLMLAMGPEHYYSEPNPVGTCWVVSNRADWISRCIRLTTPDEGVVYDPYGIKEVAEEGKALGMFVMRTKKMENKNDEKGASEKETAQRETSTGGE